MDENRLTNGSTKMRQFRPGRLFGDLRIRPKLMVLHNAFFLLLACAVYFSLIPLFEVRVASARSREVSLVVQMFSADRPLLRFPGMEIYQYREGPADTLRVPGDVREWLDAHPGSIWRDADHPEVLYRKNTHNGFYRTLRLPQEFYEQMVRRAKLTLFTVLGFIYVLAVVVLELVIMPLYVYRPVRLMLEADDATQRGDRRRELIDRELIPGDEIGQIMQSRNATVAELRKHEDDLAAALKCLEQMNESLKQKNHMLETAKKSLADQDRLASLGLLSASVAHELNTPLAVLHGSIEKLLETVPARPAQERLTRMMRVTERLRKISEGLVDFARVRRQERGPVVVQKVVDDAWALVAIDERASQVRFVNRCRPQHVVCGDADRLVQVFVNLLRNALNALGEGGEIVAHSSGYEEDGRRLISVDVDDTGPGIPPDVLPKIFEAFVTTRLDAHGTGLGLTVAEGIIHQHGGEIEAANRPEGGARLEVRLPAAEEARQ